MQELLRVIHFLEFVALLVCAFHGAVLVKMLMALQAQVSNHQITAFDTGAFAVMDLTRTSVVARHRRQGAALNARQ
ncbi:MAG: hypothetical protein ACR2PR_06625 [Pseudohongiellaceae bacterium]